MFIINDYCKQLLLVKFMIREELSNTPRKITNTPLPKIQQEKQKHSQSNHSNDNESVKNQNRNQAGRPKQQSVQNLKTPNNKPLQPINSQQKKQIEQTTGIEKRTIEELNRQQQQDERRKSQAMSRLFKQIAKSQNKGAGLTSTDRKKRIDQLNQNQDIQDLDEQFTNEEINFHRQYLQNMWQYRYWRLVDTAIQGSLQNQQGPSQIPKINFSTKIGQNLNYGGQKISKQSYWFKVFAFLGQFQEKCISLVKIIINQNFSQPQINGIDHRCRYRRDDQIGMFLKQGILMRFARYRKKIIKQQKNKQQGNSKKRIKNTETSIMYQGSAVKFLHQQYLAYNILNNLCISMAMQDGNFPRIRVPVTCLVKYLGYTVLCQGDTPCQGLQTLVYGPTGNLYQQRSEVAQIMKVIGENLNLKPFKVKSREGKIVEIPFSVTTELHKITAPLKNQVLLSWINPKSYLYPKNQKNNRLLRPQYYIISATKLWPLFIDSDIRKSAGYLRPEVVLSWKNKLSNVVFSRVSCQKDSRGQLDLADACKTLKQQNIKIVAKMLDQATFFLVDSYAIEQLFHQYGLNMKMLGTMAEKVTLSFSRKVFETEMIARTLCRIFFCNIEGLQSSYSVKQLIVDFLNLIFVKNTDSQRFYMDILYPEIQQYYEYQLKQYPPSLQGGGILHAICYHCGIKIKSIDYPFFQNLERETIFSTSHVVDIVGYSKSFSLDTCEVKKLCQGYKAKKNRIKPFNPDIPYDRLSKQRINECMKQIQMIALMHKLSRNQNVFPVGSPPESFFYAQLSQIYFAIGDYQNAYKYAQTAVNIIPQKHADNIKPFRTLIKCYSIKKQINRCLEYYQRSLAYINYHLSPNHPLSITVYNTLGFQFIENADPQKCQKIFAKSFEICQQSLGYMHQSSSQIMLQLSQLPLPPQKTIGFLLQALTILENIDSDGDKIKKVCMRISQLYYKIGNINKMIMFAKRSNHWRMQILALEKLNQNKKVLQLCDRIPQENDELDFLIRKAFCSYTRMLEEAPISNLFKLFVALNDYLPKKQDALSNLLSNIMQDKSNSYSTVQLIKATMTYLIIQIPQLLQKKEFYRNIFNLIERRDRKLKLCIQNYMQILSIVGVNQSQKIFTTNRKNY